MDAFFGLLLGMVLVIAAVWARSRYLGFPGQRPEDYSDTETSFDIREHLNGDILCEGVIFGPTGRISSRFVADMHATWDNDKGSVTEKFRYSSGETQDPMSSSLPQRMTLSVPGKEPSWARECAWSTGSNCLSTPVAMCWT